MRMSSRDLEVFYEYMTLNGPSCAYSANKARTDTSQVLSSRDINLLDEFQSPQPKKQSKGTNRMMYNLAQLNKLTDELCKEFLNYEIEKNENMVSN